MAGQPYQAGGIRVTTEATRAAGDDSSRPSPRGVGRGAAGRDHPPRDQVRLRARVATERRLLRGRRRASPTTSPSSAPTSFPPSTRAAPTTTSSSSAATCSRRARRSRRWIDVFCERGAFDAEQSRAVLEAGRAAGLGLRVHGNQLGPGPGVRLAVEMGAASADHCTYLTTPTSRRWPRATPSPPSFPRPTSRPASPIRRAPRDRCGRRGRDRDQQQPGLELHDLDELLHRARRPRHGDDRRGGAARGDPGRGARAASGRRRPPGARRPRRRGGARRASYVDLVYRPGVPLAGACFLSGDEAWLSPPLDPA